MQNGIGIAIWIVMGAAVGLAMKGLVKLPEETAGHTPILMALGGFAAVIGGMGAAFVFSVLMTFIYRWGTRGWA
jgi:hypothetical protein